MKRVLTLKTLATIFTVAFMTCCNAEPRIMTGNDVLDLLSENTIVGKWDGQDYRQYFQPSGQTIYASRKAQSSLGNWRINSTNGHYESTWGVGGWTTYKIVVDDDRYYWIDPGGLPNQEFIVLKGEQLVWPQP